jgi:hypothetical protein
MAEVQTTTQSGEMTQRFIEFVMMHAQNAALFLGQIPNPQSGEPEVNLDIARMFIDQLAMIQEKTRGNLSTEEAAVLRNTVSNLQIAFVEVSQSGAGGSTPARPAPMESAPPQQPAAEPSAPTAGAAPESGPPPADAGESRKKFTKSYGA